jgi:hypothetical protein
MMNEEQKELLREIKRKKEEYLRLSIEKNKKSKGTFWKILGAALLALGAYKIGQSNPSASTSGKTLAEIRWEE